MLKLDINLECQMELPLLWISAKTVSLTWPIEKKAKCALWKRGHERQSSEIPIALFPLALTHSAIYAWTTWSLSKSYIYEIYMKLFLITWNMRLWKLFLSFLLMRANQYRQYFEPARAMRFPFGKLKFEMVWDSHVLNGLFLIFTADFEKECIIEVF